MTPIRTELATAQRSAVHLEMRDSYMLDDPEFIAWRHGQRDDPEDRESWWNSWLEVVQETVARGVVVRRARIVSEPLSDYVRYEYDLTHRNIAAGEQVRWLPRRRAIDLLVPGTDFWAFDDARVIFNHFTGDGKKPDHGYDLIADRRVALQCASAFEAVWERAIPHDQYESK